MKTSLLTIRNMDAWYGDDKTKKKVLSGFSLELEEHETVGLIGLNGAGKTTFLHILSGLHTGYRADDILFCGRPVTPRDRDFKLCRYSVFAEDSSFSCFTSREYLSFVFSAYGKKLSDVSELVRGFHFESYMDVLLKDLSTGSRKKAFLITAFALQPRLLFLDEPVNGLDLQSTEYLYRQIAGYKEYGTVLFSSHILESIALTSDRVFVLKDGKIRRTFEGGGTDAAGIREALRYENDL